MTTTAATLDDIPKQDNDSVVLENASNTQENHVAATLDTEPTATTPSKVSSSPAWSKNGPTFAELLKQNIEVAPVAKIRTGVPIMSIPATASPSTSSTAPSTNAAKKKTPRSLGSAAATSSTSSVSKKEMQAATTSARSSDIASDSNKTPSMMSRPAPESPAYSNDSPSVPQASNSSGTLNVSSNEHMPSPPMSEIAADENQGHSSPPPAVNVWQVRMAQNMGSGTGSRMESVDGDAADVVDASGADNVDGLLDAVEKKLTMTESVTSDFQQASASGDHGDDSYYNNRRKYPYQRGSYSSRGFMSNGGGSGYPRTSRPRGAYNGVSTGGSPRYYGVRSNQQAYAYPVVDVDTLKFYLLGQIEYYFSVENLCRDLFFRSQMDANGWVPISLIAGFNRVRAYTTELPLIKEAIAQSVILEMNEESIRKKEDWHLWVLPKALESQS